MKFLSLIDKKEIHIAPEKKILPASEFSTLSEAAEILKKTLEDEVTYREEVKEECEKIKEKAQKEGFEEGLNQWNGQLQLLEEEIKNVRQEMEKTLVPLALTAIKKIIGKELETKPKTVVDIITTALKSVSQHKRVSIYVSRAELDLIEEERPRIKELFEHLQSLTIAARDDVSEGGCIIETEAGIINAQLDSQLKALEKAFQTFLKNHQKQEE